MKRIMGDLAPGENQWEDYMNTFKLYEEKFSEANSDLVQEWEHNHQQFDSIRCCENYGKIHNVKLALMDLWHSMVKEFNPAIIESQVYRETVDLLDFFHYEFQVIMDHEDEMKGKNIPPPVEDSDSDDDDDDDTDTDDSDSELDFDTDVDSGYASHDSNSDYSLSM